MKRIVLFVEGEGEVDAVKFLVSKILTEQNAWSSVYVDDEPFRVGQVNNLFKEDFSRWINWLKAAYKRDNVGGILLILDGDIKKVNGNNFCHVSVAHELSKAALKAGAAEIFSVAVVFAIKEYESWLLTNLKAFAGKELPDGSHVKEEPSIPEGNLEEFTRGAKEYLSAQINGSYKPIRHQAFLTKALNLELVRQADMRSFRRLEKAISELVEAIQTEKPIVTPSLES